MTSLIAANNASSSASASRARGAAGFEVVILRGTNTHPEPPRGNSRGDGGDGDGRHARRPRLVSGGGSLGRRWLVQHQPVQPQLAYGLYKLCEVDWLPNVAVRAQPVARDEVPLFVRRGEDDDRQ